MLAESFREHHPEGRFVTLVVDGDAGIRIPTTPAMEIVVPSDLRIDHAEYLRMAGVYTVLEHSTAIKPFFLQDLLVRDGWDHVLYLDPDMEVHAPLEDIAGRARSNGIVLNPHLLEPFTVNRLLTDHETAVLQAGTYNLGFCAVNDSAAAMLEWWAERLARDCVVDTQSGWFVDQKWINLVPSMFGADVVVEAGFNVAWWNLPNRHVTRDGSGWRVNDEPLRLFHFSGYDPRTPWIFSKHAGPHPRFLMSENDAVRALCDRYGEQLIAAGFIAHKSQQYGYGFVGESLPYDARMRRLYRNALLTHEWGEEEEEPPNPFSDPEAFVDWLGTPQTEPWHGYRIGRYLEDVWVGHDELHDRIPTPHADHSRAFLEWVFDVGVDVEEIPAELIPSPEDALVSLPQLPMVTGDGITVGGYLAAESGTGEYARLIADALDATGMRHRTLTYRRTLSRQGLTRASRSGDDSDFDVNIACVNADRIQLFNHEMGPGFRQGRYTIGCWHWEVEDFPAQFDDSFGAVDEVWAASRFARDAIASRAGNTPVLALPPVVRPPAPTEPGARAYLGIEAGFLFHFSFDFDSVVRRKNPEGIIEAYRRAFPTSSDGAALLIKTLNGERYPFELEFLREAARTRTDITILDAYLPEPVKNGLIAECDCYVSLHRSEGFGLTMAEAMARGVPVIATAYSGNLDFMNEENSLLVPVERFTPVGPGSDPYPPDSVWAEPDLDEAARLMQEVRAAPDVARQRARGAASDILLDNCLETLATWIADRVRVVRASRGVPIDIDDSIASATR